MRGFIAVVASLVVGACSVDNVISPPTLTAPLGGRFDQYSNPAAEDDYIRGINYFYGWPAPTDPDYGILSGSEAPVLEPWSLISNFGTLYSSVSPKRQSALGFYDQRSPTISDRQILAMVDAGFDYVIYQIGWSHNRWRSTGNGLYRGEPVANHMASSYSNKLKFTILWHDPSSDADWADRVAAGWTVTDYLADMDALFTSWFNTQVGSASSPTPSFHFYRGRPVLFFFNPDDFLKPYAHFGYNAAASPSAIISRLRTIAGQFGYSGATSPYLVAQNVRDEDLAVLDDWGFNASTGYVYRGAPGNGTAGYSGMIATHMNKWGAMLAYSTIDYWPSVASGSDGRPWGLTDYGAASPSQFENLIRSAMDTTLKTQYVGRTGKNIVICCWNEWGEGAYIEPSTLAYGYSYRGSALADAHRRTVLAQQPGSNRMPFGWFEDINTSGVASGWGLDPDTPNQPLTVHFYADGDFSTGTFLGGATTTLVRQDVNGIYNVVGAHGYQFVIPSGYCGHYIFVHYIDSSGNDHNPQGSGSPRVFPCP